MNEVEHPLPTGANGHDANGRFTKGNKLARGNPSARKVQQLRTALLGAVTAKDLKGIIRAMVRAAESGDVAAAKLLLDRTLGKLETHLEVAGELACSGAVVILPALEPDDEIT